ncbi:YhdP family protein [Vreelandella utahensis]|uniref:YhdP family protein n=1 Tax=Vreelandella halophila TaxID=86177 RepID=UPI0015C370CE|nr:YhdP family protein [Halomonas utahensis]
MLWALLNRLVTVVWISTLTLLILAALYVGLGRQVMANLHHFETEIETALTQALGRPVHLSDLSGDWQGLDPVLRVGEMTVGERGQEDVSLGHLKVRLDSWASLVRLRLVFRELRVSGAEATLAQQPDGGFAVAGIWQPSERGDEPRAPDALAALDGHLGEWIDQAGRLLSDPVVTLTDLQLRVEPASGESLSLSVPAMDVRFEDGLFSASGRLVGGDGDRRRIGAFALEGRHLLSSGFTGDLFLDLDSGGVFSSLFAPYEWRGLSVDALNARAETWLTFRRAQLQRARMTLRLPELGLTSQVAPVPRLSDLSAELLWQRTEAGWLLQTRGSAFGWGEQDAGAFSGRVERDSDALRVSAQGLDLSVVSAMVHRSGLLPAEEQERLAAHDPSGLVERLEVTVPDDGHWRLRGTFRDVAVVAVDGAPSGSGLDGYLEAGPREGRVTIESGPARIGFPELFHTDWRFQRLAGHIRWARRSDGWEMVARRLVGRHEGMNASGGFRLRLHEGSSDTLSLRVGIAGGRTGMLGRFIPRERVPQELYSFLTEAIGSGTVTSGWYYGHGDIGGDDAGETADDRAFTSSMAYRFRDTELTYDPDWPALEGAAGQVRVQGDEGRIQLDEGAVAGVELEPSQIRVTGDEEEGLRVDVDTGARREGELLTEQWRSSPLARVTGDWLEDFRVTGSSHVDLSLSLWPGQARDARADVRFALADGHVRFVPAQLEWRDVNGPIRFSTDDGFGNTDLDARFMGEPVTLQLRDGPEQAPVFRQQGRLTVARLAQWLERPLPRVDGQLSYKAAFRPTEGPTLRLDADLADLALDWPAPFSKVAGDDHRLTTQVDFGGADSEAVRIQGDWQPLGAFRLVMRDGAVERGRIGLGVRRTELPDEPVLSLTGNLPGADLQQWWQAVEDIPAGKVVASGEGGVSQEPLLPPLRVELGIGEPRLGSWTLSPVQLLAEADLRGEWQVRLDSDWIGGTLGSGNERALAVDLDHLVLPRAGPNGEEGSELDSGALTRGARDWPETSIRIDRLVFGERRVTDLSLVLVPDGSRIRIDPLAFTMGDLDLEGSLTWQSALDKGVSEFSGTLDGRDLKGLETLLGQTTVPISSERAEASLNMAWPGGPTDFSLAGLRAAMDFRLEDGIIDQDIEGARVFRVFGLLNTDTLWRRLQLDFSDVYESGIPFDHIEGEVLIHEGRLIFDPAVSIQAPSGGFRMSGEADLISEALDMRLVVVLPVTQNLPLAAVLFGYAPPIGGALFVLDKVFGGILSRVTSATYTVEGTWSDPKVELRNLFDTESDLDSYERPEVGVEAPERPAGEIRR